MRIALITRRYPPLLGGAEKVLSYLAPALAAEGAEVTVVTSQIIAAPAAIERQDSDVRTRGGWGRAQRAPGAEPPDWGLAALDPSHPRAESPEGPGSTGPSTDHPEPCASIEVVRLPTNPVRFVGTWRYLANLQRWLAEHPIDLAYVSMLKHDAYIAVGEGRRLGFPVVLRPEGAGATGDIAWQSWGRFGRRIARRCRQADAFVALSPAIAVELRNAGYDPTRIHLVPNGVPVPDEPWRPHADWESAPRAVFVGRLAPEKNLDVLLDAWPLVRAVYPSALLVLVGEGPEHPALEGQIDRLGLRMAVELPGPTADVETHLRAADLFVLPSREEGMSIALLEAMALALPAVASAIPGNRALIDDGVQGRLAAPGDAGALARAILDQWADPDAARVRAETARLRVIREFSIAAMARRHLDLFRRMVHD